MATKPHSATETIHHTGRSNSVTGRGVRIAAHDRGTHANGGGIGRRADHPRLQRLAARSARGVARGHDRGKHDGQGRAPGRVGPGSRNALGPAHGAWTPRGPCRATGRPWAAPRACPASRRASSPEIPAPTPPPGAATEPAARRHRSTATCPHVIPGGRHARTARWELGGRADELRLPVED